MVHYVQNRSPEVRARSQKYQPRDEKLTKEKQIKKLD